VVTPEQLPAADRAPFPVAPYLMVLARTDAASNTRFRKVQVHNPPMDPLL